MTSTFCWILYWSLIQKYELSSLAMLTVIELIKYCFGIGFPRNSYVRFFLIKPYTRINKNNIILNSNDLLSMCGSLSKLKIL